MRPEEEWDKNNWTLIIIIINIGIRYKSIAIIIPSTSIISIVCIDGLLFMCAHKTTSFQPSFSFAIDSNAVTIFATIFCWLMCLYVLLHWYMTPGHRKKNSTTCFCVNGSSMQWEAKIDFSFFRNPKTLQRKKRIFNGMTVSRSNPMPGAIEWIILGEFFRFAIP